MGRVGGGMRACVCARHVCEGSTRGCRVPRVCVCLPHEKRAGEGGEGREGSARCGLLPGATKGVAVESDVQAGGCWPDGHVRCMCVRGWGGGRWGARLASEPPGDTMSRAAPGQCGSVHACAGAGDASSGCRTTILQLKTTADENQGDAARGWDARATRLAPQSTRANHTGRKSRT